VLRIDHVVMAVSDLDGAAARLLGQGIASLPGGVHPRWGTANRIAPLGETYVELLGVVVPDVALETTLGRAIRDRAQGGDRWFALCLADDDVDATATRLGLDVEAGSRTRPDGTELRWRSAGIEDPRRTPELPFFITWEAQEHHPGRTPVTHPGRPERVVAIEVAGDEAAFTAWTAGAELPVDFVDGNRGVRAVVLDGPRGPVRIEGAGD
jgi:hypothetical protein